MHRTRVLRALRRGHRLLVRAAEIALGIRLESVRAVLRAEVIRLAGVLYFARRGRGLDRHATDWIDHLTINTGTSERCITLDETEPIMACGAPTTIRSQPV